MKKLMLVINRDESNMTGSMGDFPVHFYMAESPEAAFKAYTEDVRKAINEEVGTEGSNQIGGGDWADFLDELRMETSIAVQAWSSIRDNNSAFDVHVYNQNMEDWDDIDTTYPTVLVK